jgi:serine/threonine protein kinase/class 3 adenylate cyclase
MSFGRFRLISQAGAGRDGVRYEATDRDDNTPVIVGVLSGARSDPARWATVVKRLRRVSLLDHPSARKVVALEAEADPPLIALECLDGYALADLGPNSGDPVSLATELAHALAVGHRLGLAHGDLRAGTVTISPSGRIRLDWTGLQLDPEIPLVDRHEADLACRAPEVVRGSEADASSDIYALGAILGWRLGGRTAVWPRFEPALLPGIQPTLEDLLEAMLDPEPAARPSAREVAARLMTESVALKTTRLADPMADASATREFAANTVIEEPAAFDRKRLGRFRLVELLGEGGMGAVYRGEDLSDGSEVAIKILKPIWAARPDALRRFLKEARILSEVNHPCVANLLEVNEDEGVHYIVLEFVRGSNLAEWVAGRGRLDVPSALAILADVARALDAAHARGIIHRDIKPENILVLEDPDRNGPPRVKLSDFGLAAHIVESGSLAVTQVGTILGTPLYMSPEQCAGDGTLGPASDVYSMGATLFHLIAGRPPFQGDSPLTVMSKHRTEPPPDLRSVAPEAGDAVAELVAKALGKLPEARYADAGELLEDLERLLRGEPTGLDIHPRLPPCDPRDITTFEWRWDLESSPRALWPLVSNTERVNRAMGLASVEFRDEPDAEAGSKRMGRFRRSGIEFSWREHPFEWVEGRRMGVVREFDRGPFEWFVSIVELQGKPGGGTLLTQTVKIKPRGLLGRTVAAVEVGTRGRKAVDRIYRRVDATLTGQLGRDATVDPFEAPEPLSGERRRKLEAWLDTLADRGVEAEVVERLGDFLELVVARIRPLALARRLGLEADPVIAACLRGAADGALVLMWDILCPVCRIPSQVMDTLRALREHGRCEACQLDFDLDFANSVEMIFRVHPEIREADLGTYCAGGPAHSPHVAAQARVAPGERVVLELSLEPGTYRLRGPQLPYSVDFRVETVATARRWDFALNEGPGPGSPRALRAGGQVLALANGFPREVIIRVERIAPRDDALTAARASAMALFRELFPGEVLSPGQLINLETVTLLVTDLEQAGDLYTRLGDAKAFAMIHEQFRLIDDTVRHEGGAMVKTMHEGAVAAFGEPAAAVRAAIDLRAALLLGQATRELAIRVGVHRGPAMVATLNDHLDYFGTTVSVAAQLPRLARGGQVILSRPVASDPAVAALLAERGITPTILERSIEGLSDSFVHVLESVQHAGSPDD